jgi:hypothetical protein
VWYWGLSTSSLKGNFFERFDSSFDEVGDSDDLLFGVEVFPFGYVPYSLAKSDALDSDDLYQRPSL